MGSGGADRNRHWSRKQSGDDGGESCDGRRGFSRALGQSKEQRGTAVPGAIAGLSLALILALGVGVAVTLAYSADTQTSSGNLFAAGTLDLKTNDADGVSQTLYALSMSPGETAGPSVITLKNVGDTNGTTLDVTVSYAESDGSPNDVDETADAVAALLEVVTLNYDGSSLLTSISDTNGNGYKDVEELSASDLTGLSGIAASASKNFEIAVRLRGETPNSFQSDGITITITFVLQQ